MVGFFIFYKITAVIENLIFAREISRKNKSFFNHFMPQFLVFICLFSFLFMIIRKTIKSITMQVLWQQQMFVNTKHAKSNIKNGTMCFC